MMTERDDLHSLTGAYALDALDADERDRFEAHLETCDACTQEVADLRAVTLQLSEASQTPPPAGLRERILLAASTTPQPHHSRPDGVVELDRRRRPPPRWTQRLTAAAAAMLAAAVAGLSYTVANLTAELTEVENASEQAQRTADQLSDLLAAPDAEMATAEAVDGASGRVVASQLRGEAVFIADGLPAAPPGHTYQLWLIDGSGPESVGLFAPNVDGRVTHLIAADIADAVAVGVTIEPAGGSAQPTSDPILAIDIS
jgi:anti-sigma-K factor RskA